MNGTNLLTYLCGTTLPVIAALRNSFYYQIHSIIHPATKLILIIGNKAKTTDLPIQNKRGKCSAHDQDSGSGCYIVTGSLWVNIVLWEIIYMQARLG